MAEEEFVTVKGKKYYVRDDKLDLSEKGITSIDEIEGLEQLTNLRVLNLQGNEIQEIHGLENLVSLKILDLTRNPIKKEENYLLKQFWKSTSTKKHCIDCGSIDIIHDFTTGNTICYKCGLVWEDMEPNAQVVVKYCQEKAKKLNKGSVERLTDSQGGNEHLEQVIPYIEKPVIKIEAGAKLVSINGYLLEKIDQLPDDYEEYIYLQEYRAPEQMIREYLQIQGFEFASPEFAVISEYVYRLPYVNSIVLTYRSERDLTLNQLDDLLAAIVKRMQTIVVDLDLDMSVIKNITVQGYRVPSVTFEVLDEIIKYIENIGLKNPASEHVLEQELCWEGADEDPNWFLSNIGFKYKLMPKDIWAIAKVIVNELDWFRDWRRNKSKGMRQQRISKKGDENQKYSLYFVEKPVIRVEADAQLVSINGYLLKGIDELGDDFEDEKRIHSDENVIENLKKRYLQVQGFEFAQPEFAIIPSYEQDSGYIEGVILCYRSERDLTLSQLEDLVAAIIEKLTSITVDLDLDISVTKNITMQCYREPSVVHAVVAEIMNYLEYTGFYEATITQELEDFGLTDKTDWFLKEVYDYYVFENIRDILDILWLLAEKLDKLYDVFKRRKYL